MRKRVFLCCAAIDDAHAVQLIERARQEGVAVEFTRARGAMATDVAWERLRMTLRRCDGLIALVSSSSADDHAHLRTIQLAQDENMPVLLMWVDEPHSDVPRWLMGTHVNAWSWTNLRTFIDSLWFQAAQQR